jgi:NADP-dependent 3-hydroxy acid dehydrogenase YdfG
MPAVAIVGAGNRLGLSLARVFGQHGFGVALIARNEDRLGALTTWLEAEDVKAAAFPADVMDRPALTAALDRAAAHFGGIDVLEFSPTPGEGAVAGVLDVTVENLQPLVERFCYGAVAATRAVLPAMLAAGAGTLLFTTGASSVRPTARFGNAGPPQAALRNWVLNLNGALADKGIYAGHVAIGVWISGTPHAPEGAAMMNPDDIARIYWDLHTTRSQAEYLITG